MICSSCWFSVWDPIRVALAFVPIAPSSGRAGQRVVARRTVLTGLVMAVLLTVAGGAIARAYAPRVENALIGIGLVLIVVTLTSIARHPASLFDKSTSIEPKAIAITPLAVPGMINPVGVSLIFAEAAYYP